MSVFSKIKQWFYPESEDSLAVALEANKKYWEKVNTQSKELLDILNGPNQGFIAWLETVSHIDKYYQHFGTLLHRAIKMCAADKVKIILEANANSNYVLDLFTAFDCPSNQIANLLIEAGSDVNQALRGRSPLIYAAQQNNTDIVKLLLENNANPNFIDDNCNYFRIFSSIYEGLFSTQSDHACKKSALHYAAENHNAEMIKALLDAGGDPNIQDHEGHTALDIINLNLDKLNESISNLPKLMSCKEVLNIEPPVIGACTDNCDG